MRENNENFPFPFEGKKRLFPFLPFKKKTEISLLSRRGKKTEKSVIFPREEKVLPYGE